MIFFWGVGGGADLYSHLLQTLNLILTQPLIQFERLNFLLYFSLMICVLFTYCI